MKNRTRSTMALALLALLTLSSLAGVACTSSGGGNESPASGSAGSSGQEPSVASLAGFTARGAADDERIAALEGLGFPDEEWQAALLATGTDRAASDRLRWEALRRHPIRDEFVTAVLAILEDPTNGGTDLNARLAEDLAGRLRLRVRDAALRQEVYRVYRKLLRDERPEVRVPAFRALVSSGEELAVELTRAGLRAPDQALIPAAEALDLLDLDGAVAHLDVIRPYLGAKDPDVRATAVRALGEDPQSRPAIRALLHDGDTPTHVRMAALDALARGDDRFIDSVVDLLADRGESGDIQSEAVRRYVGRLNYGAVEPEEQVRFAKSLERYADRGASARLRDEAEDELIPFLRSSFPAIDAYFRGR